MRIVNPQNTRPSTEPSDNPFRAPESTGLPRQPAKSERILGRLVWLHLAIAVVGAVLCFLQTETVIGSGIALSVIGIAEAVYARRCANPPALLLGLSGPFVSAVWFVIINLKGWGPGEATEPMRAFAVCYAAATIFLITQAFVVLRQTDDDD